jgi:hypothetical protein
LSLNDVGKLSSRQARDLALHPGPLEIRGGIELCPATARTLAEHSGPLSIEINELSADAARQIIKHAGPLELHTFSELPDEAAQHLARHPFELICPRSWLEKVSRVVGSAPHANLLRRALPEGRFLQCGGPDLLVTPLSSGSVLFAG